MNICKRSNNSYSDLLFQLILLRVQEIFQGRISYSSIVIFGSSHCISSMIRVSYLHAGQRLPQRSKNLVVEWSDRHGTCLSVKNDRYYLKVGKNKHKFWSVEAFHLARRLQICEIFYKGAPDFSLNGASPPAKIRPYVHQ